MISIITPWIVDYKYDKYYNSVLYDKYYKYGFVWK